MKLTVADMTAIRNLDCLKPVWSGRGSRSRANAARLFADEEGPALIEALSDAVLAFAYSVGCMSDRQYKDMRQSMMDSFHDNVLAEFSRAADEIGMTEGDAA